MSFILMDDPNYFLWWTITLIQRWKANVISTKPQKVNQRWYNYVCMLSGRILTSAFCRMSFISQSYFSSSSRQAASYSSRTFLSNCSAHTHRHQTDRRQQTPPRPVVALWRASLSFISKSTHSVGSAGLMPTEARGNYLSEAPYLRETETYLNCV